MSTVNHTRLLSRCLLQLACFLLCLAGSPKSEASEISIFFFPEEVAAILESRRQDISALENDAENDPENSEEATSPAPEIPRYVHLSAILIHGNGQFEVWMNGYRYDRRSLSDFWSITKVDRGRVHLKIDRGEALGQVMEIGINQTIDLKSGRIIEGQPPSIHERLSLAPKRVR